MQALLRKLFLASRSCVTATKVVYKIPFVITHGRAMYTKRQLLKHFVSQYAIAKFLELRPQAVQAWPMDKPIPELRQYQLREREKEWRNGR